MLQWVTGSELSGLTEKTHSFENGRFKDWTESEWEKEPMSKEKLWKTFRKPGKLLLKTILKYYKKVWLFGS